MHVDHLKKMSSSGYLRDCVVLAFFLLQRSCFRTNGCTARADVGPLRYSLKEGETLHCSTKNSEGLEVSIKCCFDLAHFTEIGWCARVDMRKALRKTE
jgi:hypothetical protein